MIAIKVDHSGFDKDLRRIGAAMDDGRIPLRRFYQYFRAVCLRAWVVKAEGGTFRTRAWAKMADQYTRKTDGVTVPAWGGVPRIRKGFAKAPKWGKGQRRGVSTGAQTKAGGTVSGKLRRSGTRVTKASLILRDTGELQRWAFPPRPDITRDRLRLGGDVPDWRKDQLTKRPLLFFLREDEVALQRIAETYAREVIEKKGGTSAG